MQITKEVSRCFRRAYGYLAQARLLNEEIKSYYFDSLALNIQGLNQKAFELLLDIFGDKPQAKSIPCDRHLFGSGITPNGFIHYLSTVFGRLDKRYIITGNEGTGKSTILKKIFQAAMYLGYDVEAYHCALIPSKIEHLLIPRLGVGIITSTTAHHYEREKNDSIIDTSDYLNFKALETFKNDMKEASSRYVSALDRGVSFIDRAKTAHDELEGYYVKSMDFDKLQIRKDQVMERILSYA